METGAELIEVMQARAAMYETLASLYFDILTPEQIDAMAAQDFTELRASENENIASGFNDIYRYLRKRNTGTHQELSRDFSSCFLGTHSYKGFVAQPYESLFMDASGMLHAGACREVHRLYKSECVALRSGYDYPDDHLAFECEFMAILCSRSVLALQERNIGEAKRLLQVQRNFVAGHLGVWFRRLHDLCLKFIKTRFYRGVLNITQGFIDEELETIDDLLASLQSGLPEGEKANAVHSGNSVDVCGNEGADVEVSNSEKDNAAGGLKEAHNEAA